MQYALENQISEPIQRSTARELFFLQSSRASGLNPLHTKQGDYDVGKLTFEIGGKNKTRTQIANKPNAYLVKDDILTAGRSEIPLILFGSLY